MHLESISRVFCHRGSAWGCRAGVYCPLNCTCCCVSHPKASSLHVFIAVFTSCCVEPRSLCYIKPGDSILLLIPCSVLLLIFQQEEGFSVMRDFRSLVGDRAEVKWNSYPPHEQMQPLTKTTCLITSATIAFFPRRTVCFYVCQKSNNSSAGTDVVSDLSYLLLDSFTFTNQLFRGILYMKRLQGFLCSDEKSYDLKSLSFLYWS